MRHGETPWNAEGRWQGSRDIPLSARGVEQARALAAALDGFDLGAVAASTLVRAQETARLATGGSHEILAEPALSELGYGSWEGVADADVRQRWPELRAQWDTAPDEVRMEGGETLQELQDRAWPALARLVQGTQGDLLVVAHGGTNRVLLATILGLPLSAFWRLHQDPTCVNLVEIPAHESDGARVGTHDLGRARLRVVNSTAHLGALARPRSTPGRPGSVGPDKS